MKEEFDVNLTPQDMYRFNMYHTYHGFHGILSIVMAALSHRCNHCDMGRSRCNIQRDLSGVSGTFYRIYPTEPLVSCENAVAAFRSITEYTAFYDR